MLEQAENYDAYKPSGEDWLGKVPAQWQIKPLSSLFQVSREKNGDAIVGSMLSVSGYRGIERKRYENDGQVRDDADLADYRVVRTGQLVVNTMWLNHAGLGVSDIEGHVSPAYRAYDIDSSVLPKYAHHLLRSHSYVQAYTGLMQGIRPNSLQIKDVDFKRIPVLIPDLATQNRIVNFLDEKTAEIDEAIGKKRRLIELLNEQKAILINQAVTRGLDPSVPMKDSGVEWIGEIPAHWEVKRVGHHARVGNGSTPSRSVPAYWEDGVIPWLNSSKVNDGLITSADQFVTSKAKRECHLPTVMSEDILIGITGQGKTRGMAALCKLETTINQHLAYVRLAQDVFLPGYILRCLGSSYDWMRSESDTNGSTKGAITCEDIKKYYFPAPPSEEQKQIAETCDEIDQQTATLVERETSTVLALNEFKQTLIANAVTGKIKI